MERILRSSTTVFLLGCPGLFMLLSSPVCSFFFLKRMYQTVDLATPNVPAISLMDLFRLKPNDCLFNLHGELLWQHDVSSQQQLTWYLNATDDDPLPHSPKAWWCQDEEHLRFTIFWDQPKHPINSGHQACLEFSFLAACIYCRFMWSTPQMAQLPPHVPKPILQIQTRW